MKKIIFIALSGSMLLFCANSCRKSNINGDSKSLIEGAYLTLESHGNDSLDYKNLNASTITFTVGSKGVPVASVNVFVVLGQNLDTTAWKLVKTLPYSDGLVISVTGSDLATALGVDGTAINTDLTIYTEAVTKDGRTFSIGNTPSTYNSFPAYNMAFQFTVHLFNYVCPYDQSYFTGTFAIVTDGWSDFKAGAGIAVVGGPGANQITLTLYPAPGVGSNRKNIIANVDPATDSLTVAKQLIGDYPGDPNFSVQGTGFLSACSGLISLTLDFTSPADGDDGTFTVVMKKQ